MISKVFNFWEWGRGRGAGSREQGDEGDEGDEGDKKNNQCPMPNAPFPNIRG
ncbi:MAG: hypothetical protein KME55_22465 [Nostoc indistinguendum CM1-VF10]|jgi:hypothetical protein|nr:hypothetical protein [Nostoc indistinguendum CM1-VF10]